MSRDGANDQHSRRMSVLVLEQADAIRAVESELSAELRRRRGTPDPPTPDPRRTLAALRTRMKAEQATHSRQEH